MSNQRSLFFNVDWVTFLIYFALCVIGWFNIHSAVYDPQYPDIIDLHTNYGKQFIYIMSAFTLAIVILLLDSKFFSTLAFPVYMITIFLLILVLIVGRNVGGNQAWIPIGSFRLQPSEFAKFSTVLVLAKYLSSSTTRIQDLRSQLMCGVIVFAPIVLIMLQPDTGSALAFISLVLVMYREGLSGYILVVGAMLIALFVLTLLVKKFILIGSLVFIAAILIYIFRLNRNYIVAIVISAIFSIVFIFSVNFAYTNILQSHQRNRIDVLLGKVEDLRGEGYNVNQSKIAIGAGQLWGRGYLQGTQTKYDFVPEQSTDFIFCTIGEEWGFAGCFVVIGLYLFLLLRIIFIAERQRSPFSRIYGYGVASIIFFHFFINIGMTVGLVPVIGIPLPFISYGGSSLWSFTILLFILLKRDANRMGII
jgi:rod shape determining protein RodA